MSTTPPPRPNDLAHRASILALNGFGYQGPDQGIDNRFVIARCRDLHSGEIEMIQVESRSETVEEGDWLGNTFISVLWTEYEKIDAIFSAMLKAGVPFRTQNKLYASFKVGEHYSKRLEEQKAVEYLTECLVETSPIFSIDNDCIFKDAYFEIWNWKTEEGRTFCNAIRAKKGLPPGDPNHKDNYYNWTIFQNYNPKTLLSIENENENAPALPPPKLDVPKIEVIMRHEYVSPLADVMFPDRLVPAPSSPSSPIPIPTTSSGAKRKECEEEEEEEEEEWEEECMICMERVADTLVLPCEHCVVCSKCSVALRNTNDAKTCVQCRRPIKHILE